MRNPVPNSREPIFGAGAGSFLAQLLTLAFALCLVLAVLLLGGFAKDKTRSLLFGDAKPEAVSVAPGSYKWTPDNGLQKIN